MSQPRKQFKVLAIVPRTDGKGDYFLRVGPGYENQDGSINIYVAALPMNVTTLKLQIRELDERDRRDIEAARSSRGPSPESPELAHGPS